MKKTTTLCYFILFLIGKSYVLKTRRQNDRLAWCMYFRKYLSLRYSFQHLFFAIHFSGQKLTAVVSIHSANGRITVVSSKLKCVCDLLTQIISILKSTLLRNAKQFQTNKSKGAHTHAGKIAYILSLTRLSLSSRLPRQSSSY